MLVTPSVPGTDPEGTIGKFAAALEASVEAKMCIFVPWPRMSGVTRHPSRKHRQFTRFENKSLLRRCRPRKTISKKEDVIVLTIIISSQNAIFAASALVNNVKLHCFEMNKQHPEVFVLCCIFELLNALLTFSHYCCCVHILRKEARISMIIDTDIILIPGFVCTSQRLS